MKEGSIRVCSSNSLMPPHFSTLSSLHHGVPRKSPQFSTQSQDMAGETNALSEPSLSVLHGRLAVCIAFSGFFLHDVYVESRVRLLLHRLEVRKDLLLRALPERLPQQAAEVRDSVGVVGETKLPVQLGESNDMIRVINTTCDFTRAPLGFAGKWLKRPSGNLE